MLAGLALKRRWAKRNADRYPATARPNLVMGVNVQVCWEKFCNFWEVEARQVPMEGGRFHIDPQAAAELCDENTIGVVGILGSTFDGSYEPIADLCAALDALQERTGLDVPVHVDGASGAMVAPFLDPELVWDFRLPRVASINTSGHKYGLVYPGVGWALWRTSDELPEELVFRVNYLGGDMPTFALNFSRPGAQVVAQYYTFLRLGRDGYRAVQQASRDVACSLARAVEDLGDFRLSPGGTSCRCSRSRRPPRSTRTTSSTCRAGCGSAAGWCPRTPSPPTGRTCRCCGWCAATASPRTWPSCWSRT